MKKTLIIIIFFIAGCSFSTQTIKPIQKYNTPKYLGKYYSFTSSIFHVIAFTDISEENVNVEIYIKIKGVYFFNFRDSLKPIYKNYFFGKRVLYYKGSESILFMSDGKLQLKFIENGEERFESMGITTVELRKNEKQYDEQKKYIKKKITESKFLKDELWINNWLIPKGLRTYKDEIIKIRESLRKKYQYYEKLNILSNEEIIDLDSMIEDEVMDKIRKNHLK